MYEEDVDTALGGESHGAAAYGDADYDTTQMAIQGAGRARRKGFDVDELNVTLLPDVENVISFLSGVEPAEQTGNVGQYSGLFDDVILYDWGVSSKRMRAAVEHECVHKYFVDEYVDIPIPPESGELGDAMFHVATSVADERRVQENKKAAGLLSQTRGNKTALYPLFFRESGNWREPLEVAAKIAISDEEVTEELSGCTTFEDVRDAVDRTTAVTTEDVDSYLSNVEKRTTALVQRPAELVEATAQFYSAYDCGQVQVPEKRKERYEAIERDYSSSEKIQEYLLEALNVFDRADGMDRDRAITAFKHLQHRYEQEHQELKCC